MERPPGPNTQRARAYDTGRIGLARCRLSGLILTIGRGRSRSLAKPEKAGRDGGRVSAALEAAWDHYPGDM